MIYRFMGVYRESLWFINPNVAACLLVMTAMLGIGIFLALVKNKQIYIRMFAIIPAGLTVFAQLLLVTTYSRGGYVAMAAGLLMLLWLSRNKWVLGYAGVFILFLLIVENGVTRVGTISQLGEGSIYNRLLLWRGGMALIADNYLSGLGLSNQMGMEYTSWFQPLWLAEQYNMMINDLLTLTCAWGILVSAGIVLVVVFVFFWGYRIQTKLKTGIIADLLAGLLAGMTGYIVCGLFSTMFEEAWIRNTFFGISIAVLLLCILTLRRRKIPWRWSNLGYPVLLIAVCFTLFIGACKIVRGYFPYTYNKTVLSGDDGDFPVISATPEHAKKTFVLVYDIDSEASQEIRKKVRPLVDLGCKVYAGAVDSGVIGLRQTERLLNYVLEQEHGNTVWLLADGIAGKQLFIAAAQNSSTNIAGILVHNIPESWPFEELSPIKFAGQQKHKTIFINAPAAKLGDLQIKLQETNNQVSAFELSKERTFEQTLPELLTSEALNDNKLQVIIFERSGCSNCKILEQLLGTLPTETAEKISIKRINMDDEKQKVELAAFLLAYHQEAESKKHAFIQSFRKWRTGYFIGERLYCSALSADNGGALGIWQFKGICIYSVGIV